MTAVAARRSPAQVKRDNETAAEFLDTTVASKAGDARDVLLGLYDVSAFRHLDDDERELLDDAVNALHRLVDSLPHLAHQRRMAAGRAYWTAQDWQEWDLVSRNVD